MLTSHHYLLGSLFAVLCATGTAPKNAYPQFAAPIAANWAVSDTGFQPSSSPTADQSAPAVHQQKLTFDIAYRGSGRVEGEPAERTSESKKAQMAHRGSGRVLPATL